MARYDLGMREREFWESLPCEFVARYERHETKHKRADLRAGIIASVIANVHRGKGSRMFTPRDFMPGPAREQKQTPEQMMQMLELLAAQGMKN